jgi:hypothetical protein
VLHRAGAGATEAGVADRIDWQEHDLSRSFPDGAFDLVSAQFLHSPVAGASEREAILISAAGTGEWAVDTDEVLTRELTGPDGKVGTRDDTVLRVHRLR